MIELLYVADGLRDHVTVPHLVGRILGVAVHATTTPWARLRQRAGVSGYRRQLRFAIRQARDAGAVALLATVDRDKNPRPTKLKELRQARAEDRESAPAFPVALGEAIPHGEAWMLDDPVAVCRALGLAGDFPIPNIVKTKSPKEAIEDLWRASDHAEVPILEILENIAKNVDPSRYAHAKATGFEALEEEVRQEFGNLAN